jgi:hypothetical protein
MDPIRDFCEIKDTFNDNNKKLENNIPKYSENIIGSPRAFRKKLFNGKKNEMKQNIEQQEYRISEKESDPFQNINAFLKDRSSLVLANLDTLYNFSKQEDGYILPQVINPDYKYAILDKNKGFLKYLEYRLPAAIGFIDCLENSNVFLNANCTNGLKSYVLDISPEGVDLVVSNIFDKEILLDAIQICKVNGTFIARISLDETKSEYLYSLSLVFKDISVVKPFLENLNENYSYIVCENFLGNSLDVVNLDFEKINIPESFIDYLENYYNSLKDLKKKLHDNILKYNMYKCKAVMNIY